MRNVLFLCAGNSARSILAEALLARLGAPRIRAFSAGSHPKAAPHPLAVSTLADKGYETSGLRSKSWDEFALPDAPELDLIITLCDDAANESCPIWPGHPAELDWRHEDPVAAVGSEVERRAVFEDVYQALRQEIEALSRIDTTRLGAQTFVGRVQKIAAT